jgi:hypothetical protein
VEECKPLNAGKAFELMMGSVEEDRAAAGLPAIEEVRAKFGEDYEAGWCRLTPG